MRKYPHDRPIKSTTFCRRTTQNTPVHRAHLPSESSSSSAHSLDETLDASDAEAFARLKAHRARRRRKKLIRRGIALGVLLVVVVAGVVIFKVTTRQPEHTFAPVTDLVRSGSFTNKVDASGPLEPYSSSVVAPNIEGTIAEVKVSAGQTVNKGDVLMVIDNKDLDVAVNTAARTLKDAKAKRDAANKAAKSVKVPSAGGSDSSNEAASSAQSSVDAAQEAYDRAVAKAAERTVVAPEAGSIVAMNAQVGVNLSDLAKKDSSSPLIQIADLTQMKVTLQIGEDDINKVAVDQSATITFSAFEDLNLQGSVSNIAAVATSNGSGSNSSSNGSPMNNGQQQGATFGVEVLLPQPDARIKPGMTAQVSLITEHYDNVVMVPLSSLMTDDGKNYYVMLQTNAENHTSERKPLQVITKNSDSAVIGRAPGTDEVGNEANLPVAALQEGDVLLISGSSSQG